MSTHDLNRSISDSSPTAPLPVANPPVAPISRDTAIRRGIVGLIMTIGFFFCGVLAWKSATDDPLYTQAFGAWMTRYEAALSQFDKLTQTPHPNDPIWQVDIKQQLDSIKAVGVDIRAYQAPFPWSLNGWHKGTIQDIAANYDKFADLYQAGDIDGALAARKVADRYRLHAKATMDLK